MCKDMLEKPSYMLGFAAQTQKEQDDARKPLTEEERAMYTKLSYEWQPLRDLGSEDVLDALVEKGWAMYAWHIKLPEGSECEEMFPQDHTGWSYQRTHNFDDEENG